MRNVSVDLLLDKCEKELEQIETLVLHLGITSNINPYLSKYAVIAACGAIEQGMKQLVADKASRRANAQVKRYIAAKVRNNSANPSYDNICRLLKDFDEDWSTAFKQSIKSHPKRTNLKTSLESLVDCRNEFAHGGNPKPSAGDVLTYFRDARQVLECVDNAIQ